MWHCHRSTKIDSVRKSANARVRNFLRVRKFLRLQHVTTHPTVMAQFEFCSLLKLSFLPWNLLHRSLNAFTCQSRHQICKTTAEVAVFNIADRQVKLYHWSRTARHRLGTPQNYQCSFAFVFRGLSFEISMKKKLAELVFSQMKRELQKK